MSTCSKSPTWYAVRVRSQTEALVSERLTAAGIEVFAPMRKWEAQHRRTKRWRLVVAPLFETYLFARVDIGHWRQILSAKSVMQVLGSPGADGEPVPSAIPDHVIDELRAAQHAGKFDDTRAARKARNEHLDLKAIFPTGRQVRLTDGPFMGMAANVDGVNGNGAVAVLVEMLGRLVPVTARPEQLEAVDRRAA